LKRSLAIRERALGTDHPDVAKSLNNLAKLYWSEDRYAVALPLAQSQQDRNYERSCGIWRNLFGGSRKNSEENSEE
jgi:hypothetical protein